MLDGRINDQGDIKRGDEMRMVMVERWDGMRLCGTLCLKADMHLL